MNVYLPEETWLVLTVFLVKQCTPSQLVIFDNDEIARCDENYTNRIIQGATMCAIRMT